MKSQIYLLSLLLALPAANCFAQTMAKAQVADLIRKVENGTDEFRNYVEKQGDSAKNAAATAPAGGSKARRGTASDAQKTTATAKKDDLNDALDELNRSTNRLRRKFDPTDKWMDTKGRVEKVLDDARKINQVIARGSYGAEAARLWAVLRTGINDLARAYGVPPLGI